MKKTIFVIAIALALSACDKSGDQREGQDRFPSEKENAASSLQDRHSKTSFQAKTQTLSAADFQAYLCGMDCADAGALDARSKEEASWLFNHGYPSTREKSRLEALSRADLRKEVEFGNRAAAVEMGRRVALEDDVLEGKILLREQAQAGNIYAYYGLADVSAKTNPPSLVDRAAYLRMAYMLGDDRAALEIARMRLTSIELVEADKRASHFYSGYAGEQLRDPRPQE